jgi:hypothetical protein
MDLYVGRASKTPNNKYPGEYRNAEDVAGDYDHTCELIRTLFNVNAYEFLPSPEVHNSSRNFALEDFLISCSRLAYDYPIVSSTVKYLSGIDHPVHNYVNTPSTPIVL